MDNTEFKRQNLAHAKGMQDVLRSGFLDTLGSNRFSPAPVTFDALEEVLTSYGGLFVKGFSEELDKADANASGFGTDSLRFEYTKLGKSYTVSIFMSDYLKYVDQGVQGINGGLSVAPLSPFKFKFSNPSKSHVEALQKWIKEKNVTALITVPKGIASEAAKQKSLAYAIGYSIKQRGLRATYFKKKTIEKLIEQFKSDVALAAGDDMKINILL